jgi:hypothetical protein
MQREKFLTTQTQQNKATNNNMQQNVLRYIENNWIVLVRLSGTGTDIKEKIWQHTSVADPDPHHLAGSGSGS